MHPVRFGIVGNMGPEADEYFQKLLRLHMKIRCDQEALPMIVIKNPAIPDRTACILQGAPSPVPELIASFRLLENCGVRFAVMPCNTAHYFIEEIQQQTSVYIINMIDVCMDSIKNCTNKKIGLLSTSGTFKSKLYHHYAAAYGYEILHLSNYQIESVQSYIYDSIKSGNPDHDIDKFYGILNFFGEKSIETVILGCTELPTIRNKIDIKFPFLKFIDPMDSVSEYVCSLFSACDSMSNINNVNKIISPLGIQNKEDIISYILTKKGE